MSMRKAIQEAIRAANEISSRAQSARNTALLRDSFLSGQKSGQIMYKEPTIYNANGDVTQQWYVEYYALDPEVGKLRRKKDRTGINAAIPDEVKDKFAFKMKRAETLRDALLQLLQAGYNPFIEELPVHIPQHTLLEVIRNMVNTKQGLAVRTMQAYKFIVDRMEEYLTQTKRTKILCTEFTKVDAIDFQTYLMSRKVKNYTINNYMNYVKALFNMMAEREYFARSPFDVVKKLKVEQKVKNIPMTDDEMKKVIPYLRNNYRPLYLISRFIYDCFFREKELTHLLIEHIDLPGRKIVIPSYSGKNRKTATQPIPDQFASELEELFARKNYPPNFFMFSRGLIPGDQQINRNLITRRWREQVKDNDAVLVKKDLYALRHRSACDFITSGGNIRELQVLMRHSSLDDTEKYISSMLPQLNTGSSTRNIKLNY